MKIEVSSTKPARYSPFGLGELYVISVLVPFLLKTLGLVAWPWVFVLAPLWGLPAAVIMFLGGCMLLGVLLGNSDDGYPR